MRTAARSTPREILVSQTIEKSNSLIDTKIYKVKEGLNAFELLQLDHNVNSTYFNGLGYFVNAIDNVFPEANQYWQFLVNNKPSKVGSSSYKLKVRDLVRWKISSY